MYNIPSHGCHAQDDTTASSGRSLEAYSTVTLLARLRGLSTSQPRSTAM